jgi:hypothetical protein
MFARVILLKALWKLCAPVEKCGARFTCARVTNPGQCAVLSSSSFR